MGLKDKIAKWAALKWIKGKAKDWSGSAVLKFLDGWKTWLVALVLTLFELAKMNGGSDYTEFACKVMEAFEWQCGDTAFNPATIAGALFALWALMHKLIKAGRQAKAGATLTEINSTEGYAKLARAESLKALD
jgi:hypothetical protein